MPAPEPLQMPPRPGEHLPPGVRPASAQVQALLRSADHANDGLTPSAGNRYGQLGRITQAVIRYLLKLLPWIYLSI